jgi:hypothetical protein
MSRINIVKMATLLKAIYRFNAISPLNAKENMTYHIHNAVLFNYKE